MRAPFGIELLLLIAGPLIWFAHFLFIYAVNSLRCIRAPDALGAWWAGLPLGAWIIILSALVALLAMACISVHQHRRIQSAGRSTLHARLTSALCLLSAMAIVWQTLPVFLVSACS